MTELLARAELIKLSRVLGTTEDTVAFLAPLGVAKLRRLEDTVSSALFDEHRKAFIGLADAAKLLPASLVAKMSELVFGPMLSARVSGAMDPGKAIDVATKLKTTFLADVCVEMDPRSAADLLQLMPVKIIVEVARILLQRKDYVTMGRFVDDLTDEAIRKVVDSIADDTALVRIGLFVERPERLNELIDLLGLDRVGRIIAATAQGPAEVQSAGLAMMSRFDERQLGRFADAAIAQGPSVLNALIAVARREDAAGVVRAVLQNVTARGRASFAALPKSDRKAVAEAMKAAGLARILEALGPPE